MKNRYLVLLGLIMGLAEGYATAHALPAENNGDAGNSNLLIVEGRSWNYRVVHHEMNQQNCYDRMEEGFHFDGQVEMDGKEYSVFKDGQDEVVAYMREENGVVYLKVWELGMEGWEFVCVDGGTDLTEEVPIYDFNLGVGETAELVGFDDSWMTMGDICNVEVTAVGSIESCNHTYTSLKFESSIGSLNSTTNGEFIVGIGGTRGLLSMPQFSGNCTLDGSTTIYTLNSVTDTAAGQMIYQDPLSVGVEGISYKEQTTTKMYNLQGMPILHPTPGQLVIINGRKQLYTSGR